MTQPRVRLTGPTLAVLGRLMDAPAEAPLWGLAICQEADLGPGTVYPILDRLEEAGWVESSWEEPQPAGRPRRRFYTITGAGRAGVAEALAAKAARRSSWTARRPGGALA